LKRTLTFFLCAVLLGGLAFAETKEARDKLEKARKELAGRAPNLARVEKNIQDSLKASPDYLDAQQALADLYYLEHRFDNAAMEYKKAQVLDDSQKKLSRGDRSRLLDQLGLSQAQSRHLDDALATYLKAVAEDPSYGSLEYNLACVYGEKGDLDSALPHLKKAWELRDSFPRGTPFPDPRKDDSFKKFWDDPRFKDAVVDMVV
jgi:tetratricopeptide (TPR) repeat protein